MGKVGDAFDVARFAESFFCVSMSLLRNGFELLFFFLEFVLWNFGSLNLVKLIWCWFLTLYGLCFSCVFFSNMFVLNICSKLNSETLNLAIYYNLFRYCRK